MYHQIKGINIPSILHDQEIKTTPRFDLAGKSQEELETALTAHRGDGGMSLYKLAIPKSDSGVDYLIWEKGERPVVWLTAEEGPIGCIWRLGDYTFQEAEAINKGIYRIGIDTVKVEVFPWREYEQRAGVSKQWRRTLAQSARGDDTSKWYFSVTSIPSSAWTVMQRWEASRWVSWKAQEGLSAAP